MMFSRTASKKIGVVIAGLIAASALGGLIFYHPTSPTPTAPLQTYFDYIVEIVMENKNLNQTYGTSCPGNCAYITQLANTYAIAENYSGVAHGSLPNYLTLTSGGNYSFSPFTYNCYGLVQTGSCSITARNIIDAIEEAKKTWKIYITDFGGGCKGIQIPPFVYYTDFYYNSTRCSEIVDANPGRHYEFFDAMPTALLSDLNSIATAPNFMWLAPANCDMGYCVRNSTDVIQPNYCGTNSTTFGQCISQTNEYLNLLVPKILSSTIFKTKNAVIFITWDEGAGINGFGNICPNRGQTYPTCIDKVAAIFVGPNVKHGYKSNTSFSHFSFVKTLQVAWSLTPLTSLEENATPMTDFFHMTPPNSGGQQPLLADWILTDRFRGSG